MSHGRSTTRELGMIIPRPATFRHPDNSYTLRLHRKYRITSLLPSTAHSKQQFWVINRFDVVCQFPTPLRNTIGRKTRRHLQQPHTRQYPVPITTVAAQTSESLRTSILKQSNGLLRLLLPRYHTTAQLRNLCCPGHPITEIILVSIHRKEVSVIPGQPG